jgi:hypothetical protein
MLNSVFVGIDAEHPVGSFCGTVFDEGGFYYPNEGLQ